jgi:CubicO group peptidase (beta-lactamase class C family)
MTRIVLTAAIVVSVVTNLLIPARAQLINAPSQQTRPELSTEQLIVKLEEELTQAVKDKAEPALSRIIADDFFFTAPNGKTFNKEQIISDIKSNSDKITKTELSDIKVLVNGKTAVITGAGLEVGVHEGGSSYSDRYRFTDIFMERGGRWQLVVSQSSVVPIQSNQSSTNQSTAASSVQNTVAQECVSQTFIKPPAKYASAVVKARRSISDQLCQRVPGVQVAVAVDGKIIWSEGFGYADLERKIRVAPTTMFRIGSVSKPLTADAVALLVQKGQLDLDAPVQKYVPSFPQKQWAITPRQLAGHLAGIRGYINDYEENHSNKNYPTVTSGLTIFANDPLLFEPGTRFSYSTYGYSLLSAVAEGASGQDFPTLLETEVFRPLLMLHTTIDRVSVSNPDRAQVYEPDSQTGELKIAPPVDNSYKWAGGGILSTAEDLARFGSAHLTPGRLTPGSLDLLFTSMRQRDGKETGYGLGWYVGQDQLKHRVVSHTGSAVGGSAILLIDRDSRIVFAMCLNISGTDEVGNMLSPVWSEIPSLFDDIKNPNHFGKVERQILRLEEQRRRALLQSNIGALDTLVADDYVETGTTGAVRSKSQNIADLKSGGVKLDYLNFSNLTVRVNADTAVVTGLITRKGNARGKSFSGQTRYTRVYVKRNGRWQAVAAHSTALL